MSSRLVVSGGAALLAAGLSTLCFAQTGPAPSPPPRSRVQMVRVKPDMVNEWIDLQKNEVVPALKKGGVATCTVYQTNIGSGFEFLIVTPFAKYAEFDSEGAQLKALGAAANARLGEKQRKCLESTSNWVITQIPSLSNITDASTAPAKIVTTRMRINPGKMQEFEAMFKADLLPAVKKGKQDLTVNQRGFGANPNDITLTSPIARYADLDSPPPFVQVLGREGMAEVGPKLAALATIVEMTVRTRVPELSFLGAV